MKPNKQLLAALLLSVSFFLCGCGAWRWPASYFKEELDQEYGAGTYTFETDHETDTGWRTTYRVTLNDYPDTPFHVGVGVQNFSTYPTSDFNEIFSQAIYDEYKKVEVEYPTLYEITFKAFHSDFNDITFDLKRYVTPEEAEDIWEESMKIVSIINDQYPIYNIESFNISTGAFFLDQNGDYHTIASSSGGQLQVESKEDFLAYMSDRLDATKNFSEEGITITNLSDSSLTLGVDTLQTALSKGFFLDNPESDGLIEETMLAPGEKGLSAWCFLDWRLNYVLVTPDTDEYEELASDAENFVRIETTNLGTEPCSLADATITKVVYELKNVGQLSFNWNVLGLDGMYGTVLKWDKDNQQNNMWEWELPIPQTEEEKQDGVRYKEILVKIQVDEMDETHAKSMDITLTWDPE